MTNIKAVSESEIEKLPRHTTSCLVEQDKKYNTLSLVDIDDLRALLDRSPSVSAPTIPEGYTLISNKLLDQFPEINLSNYCDDEVRAINQWGIDIALSANQGSDKDE